jgi:hypothetical protein
MRPRLQILVSLVLVVAGVVFSAYSAGQLSVRKDCDDHYSAFIHSPDVLLFFHDRGQDDFYQSHFAAFHPSARMYSGSLNSGLFIVGGAFVALLGIAGILDMLRASKQV